MRRMLALVLVLASPSIAWAEPTETPSFPCVGRWRGLGRNTGFSTTWTIDMVVTPPDGDGSCGTIEYTRPACGGRIVQCTVEGGLVRVRERYTHGAGDCAAPGRLEFRCEGERMQWAWIGWERVQTTLTRVDERPSGDTPGGTRPRADSVPAPDDVAPPSGPPVSPAPRPAPSESASFGCAAARGSRGGLLVLALALAACARLRRRERTR